jgi:putative aminopeptidase FrvX
MPRLAIDSEYLATRLSQLLDIPSPTGYTDTIVRECCEELRRLGVKFEVTRRGGIRAFMPGKADRPAWKWCPSATGRHVLPKAPA